MAVCGCGESCSHVRHGHKPAVLGHAVAMSIVMLFGVGDFVFGVGETFHLQDQTNKWLPGSRHVGHRYDVPATVRCNNSGDDAAQGRPGDNCNIGAVPKARVGRFFELACWPIGRHTKGERDDEW